MTSDFYKAVDQGKEVREAFDKIWHTGLLYKLEKVGIRGGFSNVLKRARVTPLYIACEEFLLKNYRSVYVLSIISKIIESHVTTVFMNILDDAISSMKNSQGLDLSIHAKLPSIVLLKSGYVTLTMVS